MMTRKDYVAFVNAIGFLHRGDHVGKNEGRVKADYYVMGFTHAVWGLVEVLQADNPKFNAARFYEALEYRISTGHEVRVGQKNFDHNPFKCDLCMARIGYSTKGKRLEEVELVEMEGGET